MPLRITKPAPYHRIKPDDDCMHEECGVFGIVSNDESIDPAEATYYGLFALQHRGQESAGIAVSSNNKIDYHKDMGLISEVFKGGLDNLAGATSAIGHVRYSTTGDSHLANAQPLVIQSRKGSLALVHNGNLINAKEIRDDLESQGAIFQTTIDTEIIASLIAKNTNGDIISGIKKTMEIVKGSYALVIMTPDKIIGVRDPKGIRPIALGKIDNSYVLASESCAFDTIGAEFMRDLRPGEIIEIDKNGLKSHQGPRADETALCIFEYVYFARPDSDIDGICVHRAREMAGAQLAISNPIEADIVAGVPDSARPAAMGYAEQSGIPYKKALAKNRYVGRTFIQPAQGKRAVGVSLKLNALKRNVRGNRVILVDDSIVRGTTSKRIVEMIKLAGAKEVHMQISSPPIKHPCYFGIDTASHDQLIGEKNSVEEIRKLIGADSLNYLSIEDLLKTVEGAACNFCVGCFNGEYPDNVDHLIKCRTKNVLD
ncbi:MAG: amidophosphoribosyltransferase [Clostridia bacterium]|jgi:amidophosphoribosyltransferase|nr:amidophosphoribosyltransferase [Clostridia bacterium]